ncbi:MAG: DnaD domain protein [Clostridia bacterium]|nr:DnaD domain protein [Clostridia bacterium]
MGKTTKLSIQYRNGNPPANLGALLSNADETDLKILVGALMLADGETGACPVSELPTLLGLEQTEVDAALKFWRGAGVLGLAKADRSGKTEKPAAPATDAGKPVHTTAHRNGAVERTATLENYSSSELATLMENRRVSAQFIDEAQRIMGKIFRTYDTGILVGIVDQLGFEEEAVLAILTYAAGRGKKTLRYAEQMALTLYDEGITETASVLDRISRMERAGEVIQKIKTLFGVGSRELTTTEKRLFTAWTERFAYDIEVIRMAYDITVDNTGKAAPKYTNSILERWYAEGLRTAADVQAYIERQNAEKSNGGVTAKSYDVEDFFEAALKRSYEELKE